MSSLFAFAKSLRWRQKRSIGFKFGQYFGSQKTFTLGSNKLKAANEALLL